MFIFLAMRVGAQDVGYNVAIERILPRQIDAGLVIEPKLVLSDLSFLREMLERSGDGFEFIYEYRLERLRSYWWNEDLVERQVVVRVFFNQLDKKYRFETEAGTEILSDFQQLRSRLANPKPIRLLSIYRLDQGKVYRIQARFSLSDKSIPKVIQIERVNNKEWVIDSGWYKQLYQLSAPIEERSGVRP